MKLIVAVACALVALAAAAPPPSEPAQILESEFTQEPDGSYRLKIATSDGVQREEFGTLEEVPNEEGKLVKVVTVRGSYEYSNSEGNLEKIVYTGDENGFHPEGPSIPKNPEPNRR